MQNNVLDYLNHIVTVKPDKVAFSDGTLSLSFREVHRMSRRIGSFLHRKGIYRKPVVVFMNKSPREVAAEMKIIIDSLEMPGGRIQLILDNVQPPLVICDGDTREAAEAFRLDQGEIVLFEEMVREEADDLALQEIHRRAIDTDPVYIVFTSGSTGIPKGVAACHRSVIDYVEQLSQALEFGPDTVFGNQSPLYFDACLKELYPTIKFGAT